MAQWDSYDALAASSSVASSESERDDFESSTAMDGELYHPTSPLATASLSPPSPSSPPSQTTTTTAVAAPVDTSAAHTLSGSTAATNTTHLAPTAPGNTGQHQLAGSGQPSREGAKSLTTVPYRQQQLQRQQLQRRRFSLMEKSRRAFTVKAMELKKRLPFAVDRRRLHAKSARRTPLGARGPRPTGSGGGRGGVGGGRRPWRLTVIELHASDGDSDSDSDHNSSGGGGGGAKQRVVPRVTCHAPPDAHLTREYLHTVRANNNNNNYGGSSSSSDHATTAGSAVNCDRMNTPIGRVRCLPCSLSCSGVAVSALLPDLQCLVCQCRYHSHCVRLPSVGPPSPLTGAAPAHFVCLECYQLMTGSASLSSQARFHWPKHTDYTLSAAAGGGGGSVVGVPLSCGQWHAPDSPAGLQLADSAAPADCAAAAAAAEAADDDWFGHSLFEASPAATNTATTDINTTATALEAAPSSEYDQNYADGDYLGTPALFGRGGVPLSQAHLARGSHGLPSASLHHTPSSTSTSHGADERGPASVRGSGRGRGRGRPPLTARGDWTPRSERAGAAHTHHSKARKKLSTKAAAKAAANSGKPSAEGSEASLPAVASVAAAAPAAAMTSATSDSLPLTAAVDTSTRPGLAPGAAPADDPVHHQWEVQSAAGSGSAPAGGGGVKKRSWVVS